MIAILLLSLTLSSHQPLYWIHLGDSLNGLSLETGTSDDRSDCPLQLYSQPIISILCADICLTLNFYSE